MKFMFIDSTNQGANAKPDKAVRSFVMHNARLVALNFSSIEVVFHSKVGGRNLGVLSRRAMITLRLVPHRKAVQLGHPAGLKTTHLVLIPDGRISI